jgi:photosystem II stability/assembly factor-like uncharacterized protein
MKVLIMKKIIIIIILTSLSTLKLNSQDSWETIYQKTGKYSPPRVHKIIVYNNHITVLSYHNENFLQSNDGGASWKELYAGIQFSFNDVCYSNDSTLFMCSENGEVVKYDLKNNKYLDISPNYHYLYNAISFLDELNGFVAPTVGCILRTTDGGVNWDTTMLHFTHFGQDKKNYRMQYSKIIMKGRTEGFYFCSLGAFDESLEYYYSFLFYTNDAGRNWKLITKMPDELVTNMYIYNNEIWLVGENGLMTKSNDNGKTWQWFNKSFRDNIWSLIKFENDIYISTGELHYDQNCSILKSSDNAKTWKSVSNQMKSCSRTCAVDKDYLFTFIIDGMVGKILRKKIE